MNEWLALGVGAVIAVGGLAGWQAFAWRRTLGRKKVHVITKSQETFSGIVYAKRGSLIVLRNAQRLDRGTAQPVDGELVIDKSEVDYFQVTQ